MVTLYSHNLEAYTRVQKILEVSPKVLIEQATGTGKSFITMMLMQNDYKDSKKLYVIPKTAIKYNLMLYPEWSNHNTDFITYSMLTKVDIDEVIDKYDVFIFDEVHHAGATSWMIPVVKILESSKTCIGLTATPIRSDGIDVGETLFDGYKVKGPDTAEAIERGIWSEFKYYLTVNKVYESLQEAKRKVEELPASVDTLDIKTESAGYTLDDASSYTIRNLVQSNSTQGVNKWLVFCSNINELDTIDDDIRDWFEYDDIVLLKADSRMSKSQLSKVIETYNEYDGNKPIVLASVNILIEGMHLSNVTGMIILRHTQSLVVFLQMIGRAMTTKKDVTPVIIDVADNLTMLKKIVASTMHKEDTVLSSEDLEKCANKHIVMLSRELSIQLELLVSIEEFIEKVKGINVDSIWTDEELKILRRYYPDVSGRIKKSKIAIRKKAVELGIVKTTVWSVEEDEILKSHYPIDGMKVSQLLYNKTPTDIRNRVRQLRIKYKKKWSFYEDELVLRGEIPEGRTSEECSSRLIKLRRKFG